MNFIINRGSGGYKDEKEYINHYNVMRTTIQYAFTSRV